MNERIELKLRRKDQSTLWSLVTLAPLFDDVGKYSGGIALCQDISQRKELEEEKALDEFKIHALAQRLSLAVEGAGLGVWELDLQSNKLIWDETMHTIYGFEPGTVGGDFSTWQNCLHPEDKPLVDKNFDRLLKGEVVEIFVFRIFRKSDNELRYLEANGLMQTSKDGVPLRLIGTNCDITSRKTQEIAFEKAKHDAELANSAKSEFLANVSHEIRTPLAVIRGFAELLINSESSVQDRERWLNSIIQSSLQLELLVNDILDLSRVEAGKISIEESEINLREFMQTLHELLQLKASEKGITLTFETQGAVPLFAHTDGFRLRQILINLIGNAIKFTNLGSINVTISSELISNDTTGCQLIISVADTGIGISTQAQAGLFKAFSQADNSITRKFGGTGLGLYLSKNLANILGGDVYLKSSIVGAGSTFVATILATHVGGLLNLARNEFSHAHDRFSLVPKKPFAHLIAAKTLKGKNILVVDDAPEVRLLVSNILQKTGAFVNCAADGKEGFEMAMASHYNCVIMDLQMPVMDGYRAIKALRNSGYQQPVIAPTAHAMKGDELGCLESGFNAYAKKPVNFVGLVELLHSFKNPVSG